MRNCRVLLSAIHKRGPDGEFKPIPLAVPLQFVWSPRETTPTVVTIKREQVLDLGILKEDSSHFMPLLYSTTNNFGGLEEMKACGTTWKSSLTTTFHPRRPSWRWHGTGNGIRVLKR